MTKRRLAKAAAQLPRPVLAGAFVFLMGFGFFAATTQQLVGYEPETAGVTEGLALEGHPRAVSNPTSPSFAANYLSGRDGLYYARTGLLQPILQVPFYEAGHFIDRHFGSSGPIPYRLAFLWLYNPFVAALAAVALFALVFLTRGSIRWAIGLATLFIFASLAWPYAKIGMETTFMFTALAAFALAAWARQSPTKPPWALVGVAVGATAATKPYAAIIFLPILIMLAPTWWAQTSRKRLELAVAIVLPLIAWAIVIGWYNWYRFESPTDFGYSESSLTLNMPLNALGMLFSPGKGLIFYSPLVIIGALGIPALWRADRTLCLALLIFFISLTCISGASTYWGDEVWGPRYLVPAAWTLLVPIAWWVNTPRRKTALLALAVLACAVQLVGSSAYYGKYINLVRSLTSVPVYGTRISLDDGTLVDKEHIPYGDDPTRWIPQLSPLILQAGGLVSTQIIEPLGGQGLSVTYHPFEGRSRTVNLSSPDVRIELDYYWHDVFNTLAARVFAVLMLLMSAISGMMLYRLFGKGSQVPPRAQDSTA